MLIRLNNMMCRNNNYSSNNNQINIYLINVKLKEMHVYYIKKSIQMHIWICLFLHLMVFTQIHFSFFFFCNEIFFNTLLNNT